MLYIYRKRKLSVQINKHLNEIQILSNEQRSRMEIYYLFLKKEKRIIEKAYYRCKQMMEDHINNNVP